MGTKETLDRSIILLREPYFIERADINRQVEWLGKEGTDEWTYLSGDKKRHLL